MATLKELNSQLAAAQKKHGAKSQAAGRIQYKINQLNKGSKGTAVKSKTGVVKSKTGVVRQTDATKKKRTVTKRKTPLTGSPSAGTAKKKAPDMYNKAVALDKPNVTVTKYPKSNVKSVVRKRNEDPVLNKSGNPHAGMTQIGARTWVKKSNLTSRQKDLAREYASIVRKRNNK